MSNDNFIISVDDVSKYFCEEISNPENLNEYNA